ncbi:nuclear transport factor 2 family protein [Actinomycetospora straminea]|uniref:SnoaL-like domain-containing protein n=1 Tax=Actinomycetospora straminea TaxID=663607 RepID=A0ABP9DYN8_9PSEU|nr:nuclear transport factor 2 family protein [Actinomycetospora straminea]MDD7932414.1 nuclear transport factor 2 family protein [Actinomycetospora straminea]
MADVEDILTRNLLEVFGERDDARRRAVIDELYDADVLFQDPEGAVRGRDAIDAKVAALLADAPPAFAFRPTGPVRVSGDLGVLTWALGPEGGEPVVTGTDIALTQDGRIVRLHTLLDGGV